MTLSEFKDKIDAILIEKYLTEYLYANKPLPDIDEFSYSYRNEKPKSVDGLFLKWKTGGMDGGSWQGGEVRAYHSTDPVPDFSVLEVILEEIAPNITYLAFRKLEKMLQHGTYSENEYYGNRSDYAYTFLPISDFYEFLSENKLISRPSTPCSSP